MIGKYIFGAQAVFLAYDVSNAETFQNLEDWLALVRSNSNKDAAPILAILGNKSTRSAFALLYLSMRCVFLFLSAFFLFCLLHLPFFAFLSVMPTPTCTQAHNSRFTVHVFVHFEMVGRADDLAHMRAVKLDKHNQFADANAMRSYFVSAKTGDNINTCFYRVAAELAGVSLTKAELEASSVRLCWGVMPA